MSIPSVGLGHGERGGYRVEEWCHRYGIARPTLYSWWQKGVGPDYIQAGAIRIITIEQDDAWRERMARQTKAESAG
jgi:predicted site-specific integrase-resolvase